MAMSRSVSMPTRRSFSPTGSTPTSSSAIRLAACWTVSSGLAISTPRVMISPTFMSAPPLRWPSNRVEPAAQGAVPVCRSLVLIKSQRDAPPPPGDLPFGSLPLLHALRLPFPARQKPDPAFSSGRKRFTKEACDRVARLGDIGNAVQMAEIGGDRFAVGDRLAHGCELVLERSHMSRRREDQIVRRGDQQKGCRDRCQALLEAALMPRHEELVRFDQVEEVVGVAQSSPCRRRP